MAGAEIREAKARFVELFNSGDSKGMAEMYTEDCKLCPPNAPIIEGREAIEKLAEMMIASGLKVEIQPCQDMQTGTDAANEGETLWERGKSKHIKHDKSISAVEELTYVAIWKRVNGCLKIYMDIWNADQ
ncbi:uncharacterized protein [Amphiura filiformis]|uniref:uncharacterized protein isoform X1 n=1 Tax=Amphiura filiformis TaxID=82378 RepID=UPI003B2151EF